MLQFISPTPQNAMNLKLHEWHLISVVQYKGHKLKSTFILHITWIFQTVTSLPLRQMHQTNSEDWRTCLMTSMILRIFSSLNGSLILWYLSHVHQLYLLASLTSSAFMWHTHRSKMIELKYLYFLQLSLRALEPLKHAPLSLSNYKKCICFTYSWICYLWWSRIMLCSLMTEGGW